ncbi:carboxyltransferase domain-containing protein [Arthrobacter sp. SDTb3-6]|uniref:5-oxoprolinase subunit B/C family protein n=1 Tax=Arthrobacter sp. SDTb3-6 TaxID=2713571 RepID=UPI00159EB659|nr:carboxyltransferase domain-containing protein [Arthrobacter sp. SDTb3-6]NVN00312.1 carboxyltransferase domain-containing protein [Arthrobacter sp. SDTb3-6]
MTTVSTPAAHRLTAIHPAGTRALLVELPNLPAVLALAARLAESPLPGQLDALSAAATVLVKFDSPNAARAATPVLANLDLGTAPEETGKLVEIAVHYDGADLAEVATLTGLSPEAVVAAHTGQTWRAAFGGFAPGFAYLLGENPALQVPRRSTPRTSVPAGAVALAGDYSAVYPRQSPGGWQLIGRTDAVLWSLDRSDPALIRPQDRVRFVPARPSMDLHPAAAEPDAGTATGAPATPTETGGLLVVHAGLQSLIQDLGRPGLGELGVSAAGAVDPSAARQANRLVGNQAGDAVIENLMGSLALTAESDQVLAVTGARTTLHITPSDPDRSERSPAQDAPFALLAGETLTLGPATEGLRCYLGVRGGIAAEPVMGSRSTDLMSGIGPDPLAAGLRIPVGPARGAHVVGAPEPATLRPAPASGVATLRITPGPRDDWFGPAGMDVLTGQNWRVGAASNRIGVRLELDDGGTPVPRIRDGELASEGVVWGALQVPPSGLPVLFLADHPVTGGYPVIAAVVPEDLGAAAQLPPGTRVRFALIDSPTSTPQGTRS